MSNGIVLSGSRPPRDQRSDQSEVQCVYFGVLRSEAFNGEPKIKIGETGNFRKRQRDHSRPKGGVAFNFQYLCIVPGGTRADEHHVIRHFDRFRLVNEKETFCAAPELLDYIRWLRDEWGVWVPDCDQCPALEDMAPVECDRWLPNAKRRKEQPRQLFLLGEFNDLHLPPREVTIDDFYTNKVIVEAARNCMGSIDLDPASHPIANSVVKSPRFFTITDNGLIQSWSGNVWLNPPFSQWQDWAPKITKEWARGQIASMCVLCATRTLTAHYFSVIHERCSAMCIIRGRIRFWGGKAGDSPDDGHAVFYFGGNCACFAREFSELGNVYLKAGTE